VCSNCCKPFTRWLWYLTLLYPDRTSQHSPSSSGLDSGDEAHRLSTRRAKSLVLRRVAAVSPSILPGSPINLGSAFANSSLFFI
jgi:hypothetical protein